MQKAQHTLRIEDARRAYEILPALASQSSIKILQELQALGWSSASEIARNLGIHVATAMRKLTELESLKLVSKRPRKGSKAIEYKLAFPRLEFILDFEAESKKASEGAWEQAERIFVREKPNKNVVAESNEREERILRLVFVRRQRWRAAARVMDLRSLEGRFLWHLPFASQNALSIAHICRHVGIENSLQVVKIIEFIREMDRLGVIEIVR